ncbi:solute carrier family 22 member 15-like [Haliotis cracherodii]|uniref:solute carrier family 22 member 15-like n=1 Tax=Haliotis cracherodii TaxID=6455 RepID=UPI0039EC95A6
MSRYNKRQKPTNTLQLQKQVAEEKKLRASSSKYTYLDIYRDWSICWKSLVIQFIWICMSLVYYGISFGAGRLAGNLYLYIFLLGVVEIPACIVTFFMNNKLSLAFIFFAASTVGSFGVCIVAITVAKDDQGIIINVLAMVTKLSVGAAWCVMQLLSSETLWDLPSTNLGYGAANTAARIGGIFAPYIFATNMVSKEKLKFMGDEEMTNKRSQYRHRGGIFPRWRHFRFWCMLEYTGTGSATILEKTPYPGKIASGLVTCRMRHHLDGISPEVTGSRWAHARRRERKKKEMGRGGAWWGVSWRR